MMRNRCAVVALLLLTTLPLAADGPETGLVSGTVTDPEGQPLPGVQVTLEGGRGGMVAVTGENGSYRFALVRPGSYTVTAMLEGFGEQERVVQVTAGGKVQADLTLRLETAETITVTSEAPMVDKFNVTAGATVTAEVGAQAAGENRTYYGVINMLPGVTSDAENGAIQGTRPQVNGSHFSDNSVFIDGVDTTFARFGGSRVFVPTTATTEITMEAGGMSAEYGRVVGSSTNVIIKSGTNRFHGEFMYGRSDASWQAEFDDQPALEGREFPNQFSGYPFPATPKDFLKRLPAEEDNHSTNFEAALGGPIKRDKAWFFLAVSENDTNNVDRTLSKELVDASFAFKSRIAKINAQPGASHQLAVSYIDSPSRRVYFHTPSHDKFTPTPHDLAGDLATFNWNHSITANVFLETKLATQTSDENKFLAVGGTDVPAAIAIKQQDPRFPANPEGGRHWPGNNYASYWDSRDDSSWHNGWILDNGFGLNEYPRDQANAALTVFATDNHELKFGADWQQVEWRSNVRVTDLYVGTDFNAFDVSGFTACGLAVGRYCVWFDRRPADLLALGNTDPTTQLTRSDSKNEDYAVYARDRFTAGEHWTFNLGLRVEQMEGQNDARRTVLDDTNVSPRIATTYDVHGDGKMLLSLNTGRYFQQLNQQFTNQWMQDGWNGTYGYDSFLWCDGLDVFLTTVLLPGILPGCESGVGYNFPLASRRTGIMWDWVDAGLWNHDLETYYKDEVILGFEWQFARNWAFDAKGIYYDLGDMIGNTIQRDPMGRFFDLSANYEDYPAILRAINEEAVRLGGAPIVPESALAHFSEGRKEYEALQLQVNRRFANNWALYTNVTFSDTQSTGSGAWWNNTTSTYAYDLSTVLTESHIVDCEMAQQGFAPTAIGTYVPVSNGRAVPIDCRALLEPHLGVPVSLINRYGKDGLASSRYDEGGALADRPLIFKSFGFRQWNVGEHTFNLGGFFTWQSGIAWGRGEPARPLDDANGNSGAVLFGNGLDIQVEPVGARRLSDHWWLNLSGAWGFPLPRTLRGELRVEVTNVTDNQRQIAILDKGEVRRTRREFQWPRQVRAHVAVRF